MSIDTDKFLVSRSGTNYSIEQQNLMANLEDTDLMLVSRAGTNYKITGSELKDSVGSSPEAPVISSVVLAADAGNTNRFTDATYNATLVMNPEGNPVPTKALKAEVRGQLSVFGESDEIVGITSVVGGITAFVNKARTETVAASKKGLTYRMDINDLPTGSTQYTLPELFGGFPDSVTAGGPVEIWGYPDVDGTAAATRGTFNSTETKTASEWYILFSNATAYYYVGIAVYHVSYTEPDGTDIGQVGGVTATTLTLASSEALDTGAFKAGDVVKQNNSPVVPTSSAITNVAVATYSSTVTAETGFGTGDGPENGFDGNTQATGSPTYCQTNTSNRYVQWDASSHGINTSTSLVRVWAISGGDDIRCTGSTGTITIDATDNVSGNVVPDVGNLTSIRVNNPAGLGGFSGISVDGSLLVDGTSTLTLTDASGLSDFEVGDVVQQASKGGARWFYSATESSLTAISSLEALATEYDSWSDGPDANGYWYWLAGSSETRVDDTAIWAGAGGAFTLDWNKSDSGNWVNVQGTYSGGEYTSFRWFNGSATGAYKIDTDAFIVKMGRIGPINKPAIPINDGIVDVVVTSVSPATPSITTDGGTWNTGEVVTGPSTDITATFVSADPSVPSMTLGDVVGPWSANTGNIVVNTIENPVLVTPVSSAITAINSGTSTGPFPGTRTNNGYAGATYDGATPYVISSGDEFNGTSNNVFLFDRGQLGPTYSFTFTKTGGNSQDFQTYDSSSPSASFSEVENSNSGPITIDQDNTTYERYVLIYATGTGAINWTLTGTADAGTILTLTDDTDLAQFATGDAVYAAGAPPASFAPVAYTGNPSGAGIGPVDVGFACDLVWIKRRNGGAVSHNLINSLVPDKKLKSDTTDGAADAGAFAFTSNGFQPSASYEQSYGDKYVAWCWSAGGTTVTNNDGTIESQVRSNGSFSIVKYTGVGATVESFGHGLDNAPAMVIVKDLDVGYSWVVYNQGAGLKVSLLNSYEASYTDTTIWNSSPTSSVVNIGGGANVNDNGTEFIAYCWAESPTQSFGSYTPSGNNAVTVACGFEPAFVLIKTSTGGADWMMYDNQRGGANLRPNKADAESTQASNTVNFTSTGFDIPYGSGGAVNNGSDTYIYAAFAEVGAGPTGVIGSIDALDMTLSESTGTWEAGQQVTMDEKEAVISTLYCELDTLGNVTDLTSNDPGYVDQASVLATQAITFPTQLPSGNTPDVDLPAGTSIHISARATNEIGTSTAESNTLFPS